MNLVRLCMLFYNFAACQFMNNTLDQPPSEPRLCSSEQPFTNTLYTPGALFFFSDSSRFLPC